MKRFILFLVFAAALPCGSAQAQVANAQVVSACGTVSGPYVAGTVRPITVDTNGNFCGNNSGGSPSIGTVTPTDRGGTITLGGTAQNAAALNASRKGFVIQNPCTAAGQGIGAAEDLYVSVTGAATVAGAGNYADLAPCGSASLIVAPGTVITAAVSVNAATISHRWLAVEVQ